MIGLFSGSLCEKVAFVVIMYAGMVWDRVRR